MSVPFPLPFCVHVDECLDHASRSLIARNIPIRSTHTHSGMVIGEQELERREEVTYKAMRTD